MKPRTRSVCFSMFIVDVPQPAVPPRRHANSIFNGFPQASLTGVNRPAVCRRLQHRLDANVGTEMLERKRLFHFFVLWLPVPESLRKG
jgi:hypothetical protein